MLKVMAKPQIIAIVGPTASGKTALGVTLAQKFKGEVVSADSRAIYKDLGIGTAKPTPEEQRGVPHHLIDFVPLNQPYSLADYHRDATKAINDILARGHLPILVGGTGLYVNAVVYNYQLPPAPASSAVRAKLEALTTDELFKMLEKADPEAAGVIDRHNPRRLVRALEVFLTTGRSIYSQQKTREPQYDSLIIGLEPEKNILKERITKRVENMLEAGLENEVKNLVAKYGWDNVLSNTIKYQEWRPYFEHKITYPQLVAGLIKADLQYAKRQMTWFKKLKGVHWLTTPQEAEVLVKNFLSPNYYQ